MVWKRQAYLVSLVLLISLARCGTDSGGGKDTTTPPPPDDLEVQDVVEIQVDVPEPDVAPQPKFTFKSNMWHMLNGDEAGCKPFFAGTDQSFLVLSPDFEVPGKYEGLEGINKVVVSITADPVTCEKPQDEKILDGDTQAFSVPLNFFKNPFGKCAENEDGDPADGEYTFDLTFHLKTPLQFGEKTVNKSIKGTLDYAPPGLECVCKEDDLECKTLSCNEGETHKVIGKVDFSLKMEDRQSDGTAGSGVKRIYFTLEDELFGEVVEDPVLDPYPIVTLDFSAERTSPKVLKIFVEDCVGNLVVRTVNLDVIGAPVFEVPPTQEPPEDFGNVNRLRVVPPALGPLGTGESLLPNDLIIIGSGGVARSHVDKVAGTPGPFETLWKAEGATVIDAHMADITGDQLQDIVALVLTPQVRQLHIIRQIATYTYPDDGDEVLVTTWEPAMPPMELHQIDGVEPNLDANILRVADLNSDDRPDIIVAGPAQEHCAQVYRHNGASMLEVPSEDEEPEPQLETYFTPPLTLTGISGVSDVQVGHVNGDSYPDLVFGRSTSNMVSTVLLDDEGKFSSIPLNSPAFNGSGTEFVLLGDIYGGGIDDVVVTNAAQRAVYFLKSKGNGYIYPNIPCVGEDMHIFGYRSVSNMVGEQLLDDTTTDGDLIADTSDWCPGAKFFADIVMLGGEPDSIVLGEFSGDGVMDLAAAMTELNQIAVYTWSLLTGGKEGIFISPGKSPRSLVKADFNIDDVDDLACLLADPPRVAVIMNENVNQFGGGTFTAPRFKAPLEIPMPVGFNWTSGRVVPTHFAVEDLNNDSLMDIVVATQPDKQFVPAKLSVMVSQDPVEWGYNWDESKSLPLILTFLSDFDHNGNPFPVVPAIKSPVSPDFDQAFSGFVVGEFDGISDFPDIAVSVSKTAKSICDGRTFDILRGGHQSHGVLADLEEGADKYTDGHATDYYNNEYNAFDTIGWPSDGHFWALGGFLGLQAPAGLAVGTFNTSDTLDDILLFAPRSGSDDPDHFQHAQAAVYLTKYDAEWMSAVGPPKCDPYPQVWYKKAPYWPLWQTQKLCAEPALADQNEEDLCIPLIGEVDPFKPGGQSKHVGWMIDPDLLEDAPAEPAAYTYDLQVGEKPIAAVVADFDPNSDCPDVMVANSSDGDVTYLRGWCGPEIFKFGDKDDPPEAQRFTVGAAVIDVQAGDVNGDDWIDAVVAMPDNIAVLYGVDGKVFHDPEYLVKPDQSSVTPSAVVVQDVNDDQMLDIIVTSNAHDEVVIYINAGVDKNIEVVPGEPQVAVFTDPFRIATGKEPIAVTSRDIDNDGCYDLAVLNQGTRSVTLLRSLRCQNDNE